MIGCVFISYRRADVPDTVARLYERLAARLRNRQVFYDHTSIELGEEFPEILHQQVTTASVVLIVIGPNWVPELRERAAKTAQLDFVREEVRLALSFGQTVIPVLVGGVGMPTESDLADFPELLPLLGRNALRVRHDPDFEPDVDRLISHLERTGPAEIVDTILGGKYKVLKLVAVGGMGEVHEAQQTDMKRTVAVKLIKVGMDSKEVIARFDAERQALAVMDHPNVCKVLDAGIAPNGRPFFVMEFVRGVPITQYCDDRKLSPKARLELFTAVCKAVQHSHQKGIIHRDLKPGNVLVEVIDGKPVPKVIDFGLAKALGRKLTDQSMAATEYGKWVGTLEYSSPEQAEGRFDIDTLTDVYSLGVLLHELLVGSPPFSRDELLARSEDAAKEMIRTSEPTVPSLKLSSSKNLPAIAACRTLRPKELAKTLRGDLDWIILKALAKEKDGRYLTPTALADDIERHLTDQPISTGKPSAWVRLRKFYRRNRPQVIAGVLVAATLVIGIVGTGVGLLKAEEAREREKQRADGEAKARLAESVARSEEQKAKEAANASRQKSVLAYSQMARVLGTMTSGVAGRSLREQKSLTPDQETFLGEVLDYFKVFVEVRGDTLAAAGQLAEAAFNVGLIQARFDRQEEAERAFSRALDALGQLLPELTEQNADRQTLWRYRRLFAEAATNIAHVRQRRGNGDLAEASFRQAVSAWDELVDQPKADPTDRRSLADVHNALAALLQNRGRPDEAVAEYLSAASILEGLNTGRPESVMTKLHLAITYSELGALEYNRTNWEKSANWYGRVAGTIGATFDLFPDDDTCKGTLRRASVGRAMALDRAGRFKSADESWEAALSSATLDQSRTVRSQRAYSRAVAGRIDEALSEISDLRNSVEQNPENLYRFASVYSIASAKVAEKKEEYGREVFLILMFTSRPGSSVAQKLKTDKNFDPVRGRDDFKQLLIILEERAKAKPKK